MNLSDLLLENNKVKFLLKTFRIILPFQASEKSKNLERKKNP